MVATTPHTSTSHTDSGADMAGDSDDLMDLADAVGVSRADGSHENFIRPENRPIITAYLYLLWNLSGDHR